MTFKLVLLLLSLLASAAQVHGYCSFSRDDVAKSNVVFTYVDSEGHLQLQRKETVDTGVTLSMHCKDNERYETTCQSNGRFHPPLLRTCKIPLGGPSVVEVPKTDYDSCKAAMYSVRYVINNEILELYRACYSRRDIRALFSEVTIYPKSIYLRHDHETFSTDKLISPVMERSFLERSIYYYFMSRFGRLQRYVRDEGDQIIDRGHLTAAADFLFVDQSDSTYKYLNVVPQFKSINRGNWNKIEEWVRAQIPANSLLHVQTGSLEVLELKHASPSGKEKFVYLYDEDKNPVPKWMYKLVRDVNNQPIHAIITYNNIYENRKPPAPATYCKTEIPCSMHLAPSAADGYTYCCDPKSFIYSEP